ncbi:annexin D4-like [Zingiber officinale]|uniref:annexin D4-like n=1 Tax=Zingiber officinale TaxID=94328 RepID=UPI001C4D5661|nr:annexin D4-like [Zingiber officinale]
MAEEFEALTRAFSGLGGLGVDESSLVTAISKWRKQPEKRGGFRSASHFFDSKGSFDRCEDTFIRAIEEEFSRFKDVMVEWAMHPWERDARWIHLVLHKDYPISVIVEIASTRSSDELLGVRKAYHALYHHSIEEEVAYRVKENYSGLLVGLVSAYRYEGSRVDHEMAKSEAKILGNSIKNASKKDPVEDQEVIRILTTRSKAHISLTFKHYKEMFGKSIDKDLVDESCLHEAAQCLESAPKYFSKVIDKAFEGAHKTGKDALARVIVSRADVDMEEIKKAYQEQYNAKLEDMIVKNTHGNYREALLSLVQN